MGAPVVKEVAMMMRSAGSLCSGGSDVERSGDLPVDRNGLDPMMIKCLGNPFRRGER